MKRVLYLTCISILISSSVWSQTYSYQVGEKINYSVQYGFITGGTALLELKTDTFNGKEVWHSKIMGKTTGVADAIYKAVSYTHLRAHETVLDLVCRLLLE